MSSSLTDRICQLEYALNKKTDRVFTLVIENARLDCKVDELREKNHILWERLGALREKIDGDHS